jgi:1,4-alpha-glucan branching enzyme
LSRVTVPAPDGESRGQLALVLHTHMPYVEGFGTWPFGEEWLWEAMATCYLPLLDVLAPDAPVTLSLTPVLCDQLAAGGVAERFLDFIATTRRDTHRLDIDVCRAAGAEDLARELQRAAQDYERAAQRFETIGRDLLGELLARADWTSAASHAALALCATDAGARLQIQAGIASHRARRRALEDRGWRGGFWLPECAFAPWLDPLLAEAGVRVTCVDLTDRLGLGAPANLRPLRTENGLLLAPIDRVTLELVWSDDGYPAHARYRDYHHHTLHHHNPWANDGATYDHTAASALAREHAAEFVAATIARLDAARAALGRPGLVVCALDTELLGHWWYEGVGWLEAVLAEADRQGLALTRLDEAVALADPVEVAVADLGVSSWGTPRDLSTWDGPAVAGLAWATRDAELRVVRAGAGASELALRELLALQSSDWAFMITRALAGSYPEERAAAHGEALDAELRSIGSRRNGIHNLGAHATRAPLLEP